MPTSVVTFQACLFCFRALSSSLRDFPPLILMRDTKQQSNYLYEKPLLFRLAKSLVCRAKKEYSSLKI